MVGNIRRFVVVDDDSFRLTGEIRGSCFCLFFFLLHRSRRCRSLLAHLCAGRPTLNSLIEGSGRHLLDHSAFTWVFSLAYLAFGRRSFSLFVSLSLVIITDTHSRKFSFRVPEIKKWESGSTLQSAFKSHIALHIDLVSLTSHSTSTLSVSQTTSTVPYLDDFVSHNSPNLTVTSIR